MDFKSLVILISAGINLFLGILVYSKGKVKLVNKIYSLIAFSVFYWSMGMILYRTALTVEDSIFWCKILYTAPIFIVGSFLYFSYIFPTGEKVNKSIISVIFLFCSIMLYITYFTNWIVEDVAIRVGMEKLIVFGKLYLLYSAFISGFFIWSYIKLLKKILSSTGIVRKQVAYVFWGTFLASTLGMVTNLLLPTLGNFYFNWAGQIFSLLMVIFIAYAIITHRLMDIKLVMRRSSVFLMSLSVVLLLAIVVKYLVALYFVDYAVLFDFLILVAAVYFFPILRKYFYKLANKYFFSSLYDSREVIAELSEKLRSTLDASRIYDYISETLEHAFHSKAVGILIFNEKRKEYQVRHNHGFDLNGQRGFAGEKKLYQLFIGQNKSIVVEEVKRGDVPIGPGGKKTIKLLEDLKVEVLTPLNIKDRTVGLIALGQKESNDMYNDEDLQVLEVVGAQAAIAIENAILYEEQKNFNIKLEKEVEKATHDLKKANEQLIKLDQAKSDFISIASHQLRTPLTVVKGYISMILEGNFGNVTPKLEDPLDKIYESNDRLIKLVENLLNISRIESGRLQFEAKKMHLEDLATSVVDELSSYAAKKKIKLTLKKPKKALPAVKIDEEKIRQVVMNLIDNAIKYTKNGGVTVEVKQAKDNIRFCVIDSGMGIDPKDQVNLFKKFHRGEGTVLVHTEGTGLGLYVARNMLSMHKGRIWAESKGVGKGSKFCFELPIM